jgi:uncharacterized membrane protein
MNYIISYVSMLFVLIGLDFLWLGHIMKGFYAKHFGDLLRSDFDFRFAFLFYAVYVCGILFFAVMPNTKIGSFSHVVLSGALFGFFCYMTYDLTNAATLKGFPLGIMLPDILWGAFVTMVVAGVGYGVLRIF